MASETPDSTETQRLLERVRAGDRQAFDELFARHRPYLRQVIGLRLDPQLRPSWEVRRIDRMPAAPEAEAMNGP